MNAHKEIKKTIAITGITGKSGQFFLKKLAENSQQVKDCRFLLLCRSCKGSTADSLMNMAQGLCVEIVHADLQSEASLKQVFSQKIDMLIHIAGIKFSKGIVSAALASGVDNYILVHTTGIYSKYKAAGEGYRQIESDIQAAVAACRQNGRDVAMTILRPTMIYGDLQDKNLSVFIKMVDKLRLLPVVNGARYDLQPVWCKDLGDAYYGVMENWSVTKNKEYILSGGAPIQLRQMFREIARQLGVKNVFVSCPFPIAYGGAWVIYLCSLGKIDLREKVQRLVEPRAFEHKEAEKDFGYSPAEFAQGIQQEIQMYQESKLRGDSV